MKVSVLNCRWRAAMLSLGVIGAMAYAGSVAAGLEKRVVKVADAGSASEGQESETVTVEVSQTLWEGVQEVIGWSGAQKFSASDCVAFKAGDRISVEVTALSGDNSQVDLRNGAGWANFEPPVVEKVTGREVPLTVTFVLTQEVCDIVRANGMVVTGCNFTFTKVTHTTTKEVLPSAGKGDEARTIWTGEEAISWESGSNNSVLIPQSQLGELKADDVVRVYYSSMKPGGIGRILAGWTALDGFSNPTLLGARYYEYTLTQGNVDAIMEKGLRVSGNNYTLSRVDIIDPARKYLLNSEFDRADIKAWEKGESPKIGVTVSNLETVDLDVKVEVDIDHDMYSDYDGKEAMFSLAAGETRHIDIPYNLEPGFYNLNVYVNGDNICSYVVGSSPREVVSAPDANLSDIRKFWDNELEVLSAVPLDAVLTEIPSASTANRKVYLVSMKSTPDTYGGDPVEIRGFYAEPVEEGEYPAIIQYQGTDGGSSAIKPIGGDDNIGWCELVLSTRGQMLNNRAPEECEWAWLDPAYDSARTDASSHKIDYYAWGLGDKERHYYRGANIDCVRAIDFLETRGKVSKENIFAVGGSQGSSFVYAAAALGGGRIKACAPSITGHSDFRDGSRIVSWPKNVFDAYLKEHADVTEDELYEFLSYFDVMNFGPWVKCPVITSFSLQDRTDPPHINVAPFNNITDVAPEDLQYVVNPYLGHGTASEWKSQYMKFFNSYRSDLPTLDPDQDINLWKGECATGAWTGYQVFSADRFDGVKAGDFISVTVSEVADNALLMYNNGSWAALVDADAVSLTEPCTVETLITFDMLAEIQKTGLVVKGTNFTFTSVDIRRGKALTPDDPDSAVRTVWEGSSNVDWNKGAFVTVAPAKFEKAEAGNTLRIVYSGLRPGAQAHLNCGWTAEGNEIALPDAGEYLQLYSSSFSYAITPAMLEVLNAYGLNVLGVGFDLAEVQVIDGTRLPSVDALVDEGSIRSFGEKEECAVAMKLTNRDAAEVEVAVALDLRRDDYSVPDAYAHTEKTVKIPAGAEATVAFPMDLDPGVYHFVATANYEEVGDYNIAVALDRIESAPDPMDDFADFWQDALAELQGVEPAYTMTRLEDHSTSKRNVWLVEMKSVADSGASEPVTVRGYYAEPVEAGTYPAYITYQGYDSNPETQQYIPYGDSNPDRIDFVLSTRGQGINNRGEYREANAYYGDWFMFGFGDRDGYYYRGAYMDAVRAYDFVASRDKVQIRNIFAEGHSQGGALTIAACALTSMRGTGTFNSIAPAIPFMGDFPDYFRIGSWPSTQAYSWLNSQSSMTEDDMYGFLSYFDTKNLAPYISSPTISVIGLQDVTCPPHTNVAPFNLLNTSDRELVINNMLGHSTHSGWNRELTDFFTARMNPDHTSGVSVSGMDRGADITVDGNVVTVSGDVEALSVYDFSGAVRYSGANRPVELPTGLYIVKAGSATAKVTVK